MRIEIGNGYCERVGFEYDTNWRRYLVRFYNADGRETIGFPEYRDDWLRGSPLTYSANKTAWGIAEGFERAKQLAKEMDL